MDFKQQPRAMVGAVLILSLIGLILVIKRWDLFTHAVMDAFSFSGIVSFALALVVAKACHELGHALVATRLGVRVAHMGVAFIVLWPMLYTDTGESWKLRRSRSRAATSWGPTTGTTGAPDPSGSPTDHHNLAHLHHLEWFDEPDDGACDDGACDDRACDDYVGCGHDDSRATTDHDARIPDHHVVRRWRGAGAYYHPSANHYPSTGHNYDPTGTSVGRRDESPCGGHCGVGVRDGAGRHRGSTPLRLAGGRWRRTDPSGHRRIPHSR